MRRFGVLLAGIAAGVLAVASFVVQAPPASAADLIGYDMSADATGVRIFTVIPDQLIQPELDIPQASSSQQLGSGYGLASAAWPGSTVANGGSVVGVLIPGFPPEIAALLVDPVRAEARTGQEPPTTTFDLPGLTMRSRADTTSSEADAGVQGLSVIPGGFGVARAIATSRATDNVATSTAHSIVQDLNVNGVLKIGAIVSDAKATSDGETASGTATTVITGATVMGQGVTIDATGLHIGKSTNPINAVLNQLAKAALSAAGISITLGPVTHEINGPQAIVGANSLVITIVQGGYTVGMTIGGAQATAVASTGDVDSGSGDDLGLGGDVLGGSDFSDSGLGFGDLGDLGSIDGTGDGSTGSGTGVPTPGPALAANVGGHPLSTSTVLFSLAAALLLAVGMRRLNTAVLADPTAGIACTLPGESS